MAVKLLNAARTSTIFRKQTNNCCTNFSNHFSMDRKEFIRTFGYACLCAPVLVTVLQSCGTTSHIARSSAANGQVAISKSEFVEVKKESKNYRKYVIVKSDNLEFPICVFRFSDEEYTALLMRCTH